MYVYIYIYPPGNSGANIESPLIGGICLWPVSLKPTCQVAAHAYPSATTGLLIVKS